MSTDNNKHLFYMNLALEQAKLAAETDEVPVGAVVVSSKDKVIAKAYNQSESLGCQTGHAEILAIEEACKKVGGWRLDNCRIYITLEPCLMCFGLIKLSRLNALFYGSKSSLFGCGVDNENEFPLYKKGLVIKGGLEADKSVRLLKLFFDRRRKEESRKWKREQSF